MKDAKLNVKEVKDKGKDRKSSMDARERAVFSAYERETDESGYADLEIDAEGIDSRERAKSLGFFKDQASWIHFLHENVNFNINATRFKGKESYQVRGGVVEIGQGLVLDMNSVTLIGLTGNKAYTPEKENVQFIYVSKTDHSMHEGEVSTEPLSKESALAAPEEAFSENHIPVLHGFIRDDIKLNKKERLKAGTITLTEKGMVYDDAILVSKKRGIETEQKVRAEIGQSEDNDGQIKIVREAVPATQSAEDQGTAQDKSQKRNQQKRKKKVQVIEPNKDTDTGNNQNTNIGTEPGKNTGDISLQDIGTAQDTSKDVITNPGGNTDQDVVTDPGGNTDQDVVTDPGRNTEDIPGGLKDIDPNEVWETEQEEQEGSDLSHSISLLEKSVNNETPTEKAQEELNKDKKIEEISVWDYIQAFVKDDKDSAAGQRLQWVKAALRDLMAGKLPGELEDSEKEQMHILDAPEINYLDDMKQKFPILPCLDGFISLTPDFEVGVSLDTDFNISNADQAKEKLGEFAGAVNEKLEPEQAKEKMMNFLAVVAVDTGVSLALKGSISAKVALGLIVGLGSLISASSSLYADLKLSGQAGDEDEILKATLTGPQLNLQEIYDKGIGKEILNDGFTVKFEGGIGVSAEIGGEINLESEVFQWEQGWEKDFASWDLAKIQYSKEATHEAGASIFDLQFVQSAFSAQAFKHSLKETSSTYGFTFSKESIELNKLVKQSRMEAGEVQELLEAFSVLENKDITDITENDLDEVKGKLIEKELIRTNRKNELENKKKTKVLQQDVEGNVAEVQENIKKHQSRLDEMRMWKEQQQEGAENKENEAYLKYLGITSDAKGLKKYMENELEEKALEQYATKEALLKYEQERNGKLRAVYEGHIAMINNYISQGHDEKTPSEDFVNQYLKAAGDSISHLISQYVTADQLREYEEGRVGTIGEKHQTRLDRLKEKAKELNIEDKLSEKNGEFLEFYKKELKGQRILEDPFAYAIDIDALIDMETNLLEENTGKHYEIYDKLNELNRAYSAASAEAREKLDEKSRDILFRSGLYTFEDYQKYAYKSLTVDELIEYEQRKTDEIQAELIKEIEKDGKEKLLKSVDRDGVLNYFFKNDNRREVIRESVDIETLIQYEVDRFAEYRAKGKKQDAANHKNRVDALTKQYDIAMKFSDTEIEKRQEMFSKIREDYFSGAIDVQGSGETTKDGAKENTRFLDKAASGKKDTLKYVDRSMTQALIEKALTQSQKVGHRAHYNDLMRLKELKAKAESGEITDAEIWAVYRDRGGGKGFARNYLKEHKQDKEEDITTPQMFRYMANRLGKKSRAGWFKRHMMSLINDFKKEAAGEEGSLQSAAVGALGISAASREEFAALLESGGLQRLRSLVKLKDQEEFQMLEPEERRKQLAAFYKSKLQGDKIIKDYYKEHVANYLTPAAIMQYEEGRLYEKTRKHQERLKMLNDTSISDEEKTRQYRQLAMEDGNELKDKFNYVWSLISKTYATGADKAIAEKINTVLTPASALDFEQKSMEKASAKHQVRIDMLKDDKLTDREAWDRYRDLGGGDGFKKSNELQINSVKAGLLGREYHMGIYTYDQIHDYETKRLQYYKNREAQAQAPMEKLDEQIKVVTEQIMKIQNAIEKCEAIKKQMHQ